MELQILNQVNRLCALATLMMQGSMDMSVKSSATFVYGAFVVRILLTICCYVVAIITVPSFELSFNRRYAIADIIASTILLV